MCDEESLRQSASSANCGRDASRKDAQHDTSVNNYCLTYRWIRSIGGGKGRSIDAALNAMMITASRAGGYQRDTDSVVSIERIGLSVFVLPQPHPVPLSAPAVCLIYSGCVRFDQVQVQCKVDLEHQPTTIVCACLTHQNAPANTNASICWRSRWVS